MSENISAEDKQIFEAIDKNDISLLKALLVDRQNVNILDENLMAPLQHAAFKGNKEVVQMLLDQGADANLCQHQHGYTALHFAGLSGSSEVCTMLLLAGAKPNMVNSVNRTPSQMAAFVGNHNCVAIINNFVPWSDIECYTIARGQQTRPLLLPFIADGFHKFVMQVNVHPVKVCLRLQRTPGLLDHIAEVAHVLERMSRNEIKDRLDTNEVMSFKYNYLSSICQEIVKQLANSVVARETTQQKCDMVDLFIKNMLKVNSRGELYFMDSLLRDWIVSFHFHESTLFQQMISSLSTRDPPSTLSIITSAINGQRGFSDHVNICITCGEENPEKKCSKCKCVWYCDKECQTLHWFVHKKACDRLRQEAAAHQPDEVAPQAAEGAHQTAEGAQQAVNNIPDPNEITEEIKNLLLSN